MRAPELARAARRLGAIVVFGALPVVLLLIITVGGFHRGTGAWAIDFNGNMRIPAQEVRQGISPYHPEVLVHVRDAVAAGHLPDEYQKGVFPTYPPPAVLLGVPFSFLPQGLSDWLWAALLVACGWLALRLVGVRDWRIYGAALLTPAALSSVLLGALDLVLMLGIAAAWRWRDHPWRAGAALGAVVALKLIPLPLVAWLVATRRWRAAVTTCAVSASLWLVSWALIGFHGFSGYPRLLSLLTDIESNRGYSGVAYANLVGISGRAADFAPYVLGACLLVAIWAVSRRREGGDEAAFFMGVLLLLAVSPIVWHHYLVLLFVPLAVYRPRLAPIWTLPLLFWVVLQGGLLYTGWVERVIFLIVVAGLTAWVLTRGGRTLERPGAPAGTLPAWR